MERKVHNERTLNSSSFAYRYHLLLSYSDRAISCCRECSYNETELLQNHGSESLPDCYPVPKEGAWLEANRPSCETSPYITQC